jgi:hypothetical protein
VGTEGRTGGISSIIYIYNLAF